MTDAIALRELNPTIFMFGLMRAILSFIDTKNTVPPVLLLLSIVLSMAISPGAGAPLSGYSSVNLPGYTMGNYLSRHCSHVLLDARIPLPRKLGLVAFGGLAVNLVKILRVETFPAAKRRSRR